VWPPDGHQRVLVTGGAGFIGSHLVDRLREGGMRVGVLDDLSTGAMRNLDGHRGIVFHRVDIRDGGAVRKVVRDYQVILHQSALVSVTRSVEEPLLVNQVNVGGTLNLLKAAVDSHVERFVYASSSSAYGDTEALPKVESMPTTPSSPYGVSKLAAESYCRAFAKVYGLKTVSLRYFNVYGPRQKAGFYSGVIPTFITRALGGKPPVIYGDGTQTRDFTFVEDVVQANILALKSHSISGGEVFNIASGRVTSVERLASTIAGLVGRPNLRAEHVEARKGDIRASYADITKARRELGYRPRYSLLSGLERTIAAASPADGARHPFSAAARRMLR